MARQSILTAGQSTFKSPAMINAATIFVVRARRTEAVRAVVCV
jgi:hypothetical protein